MLADEADGDRAFADGGRYPLDRPAAHVPGREHAGQAGFQQVGITGQPLPVGPAACLPAEIRAREDEAVVVQLDRAGEPLCVRLGADENEGPWLPEPLVTAEEDAGHEVEQSEAVSLAMLVVLETLSPLERAIFVLKEVFGFSFTEIAGVLDRSETCVRQVGARARSHVQARRPRYDAPADTRRRVTDQFLAACLGGDLNHSGDAD